MKSCLVLLGSYNGEQYLREQLDSILAQQGVSVSIVVSDDCSKDGTVGILSEYQEKFPQVSYSVNERNKNFTYNFLDLMFKVKDGEYDYYAFADQDDVWLPDKLARAIEKIESAERHTDRGALYCSNLILADKNLNRIGMMEGENIRKASKKTFPFENIATGCTVVIDRAFLTHATSYYPENIRLHDYWLFLIAAYTADYVYDEEGYILYRQHGSNQIGSNQKKWTKENIRKFIRYRGSQSVLVRELIAGYGQYLNEEDLKRLTVMRDYKRKLSCRMKIIFCWKGRTLQKTFLLKLKALMGKL